MRDLVSLPLMIMFNGSVDVISLSTVSIDSVDLVLFCSYWVILTSLFEWMLLFSLLWLSLSLTTFSNKKVIMVFMLFSSSSRKLIFFYIWWRSFPIEIFHQEAFLITASWFSAYEITFKLWNFSYKRMFRRAKLLI